MLGSKLTGEYTLENIPLDALSTPNSIEYAIESRLRYLYAYPLCYGYNIVGLPSLVYSKGVLKVKLGIVGYSFGHETVDKLHIIHNEDNHSVGIFHINHQELLPHWLDEQIQRVMSEHYAHMTFNIQIGREK